LVNQSADAAVLCLRFFLQKMKNILTAAAADLRQRGSWCKMLEVRQGPARAAACEIPKFDG